MSPRMLIIAALLPLGLSSCKPEAPSALLESGGTNATWQARPTLTSANALNVTTTVQESDRDNHVASVSIKIESSPDGTIPQSSLKAKEWMALAIGTAEVNAAMLLTTRSGTQCYVNSMKLNGQNQSVACKNGQGGQQVVSTSIDTLKRRCEDLSRLTISSGSNEMFAVYQRDLPYCECRRGTRRDLYYEAYTAARDASVFENDCKAIGNETSVGIAELQRACLDLRRANSRVSIDPERCHCIKRTIEFNSSIYLSDKKRFTEDCRAASEGASGNESLNSPGDNDDDDEYLRLKAACTGLGHRIVGDACTCGRGSSDPVYFSAVVGTGFVTDTVVTEFKKRCKEHEN